MSRSRRKTRFGKCCCGRHLIPMLGTRLAGCPILERAQEHNEMFLRNRELRSRQLDMGDEEDG